MRALALFQGGYFFISGLWSLVSIETFMLVTGPKTDIWLVHTVGALVIAISVPLIKAGVTSRIDEPVIILASATALALASVEIVYVSKEVISPIYAADAALELLMATAWLGIVFKRRRISIDQQSVPKGRNT